MVLNAGAPLLARLVTKAGPLYGSFATVAGIATVILGIPWWFHRRRPGVARMARDPYRPQMRRARRAMRRRGRAQKLELIFEMMSVGLARISTQQVKATCSHGLRVRKHA